jgi:hypothetical protein
MRKFTILLFRDDTGKEDDTLGTVGTNGSSWKSAPLAMERLNVVLKSDYDELVEALQDVKLGLEQKLVGSDAFTLESMIYGVSKVLTKMDAHANGEK